MRDEKAYGAAAEAMVRGQLADRGIEDPRVLAAMRRVPRHRFVEAAASAQAYADRALPTCRGQTISQPYMVAAMTQTLSPEPGHRVLEIGTGSGYQTAVLAVIGAAVWSIERDAELSAAAAERLDELGIENVHLRVGDGTLGWPEAAPFDRILVTAGAPEVPEPLLEQLADGGRLVIPVGGRGLQQLVVLDRRGDRVTRREHTSCRFVPLVGAAGWPESAD